MGISKPLLSWVSSGEWAIVVRKILYDADSSRVTGPPWLDSGDSEVLPCVLDSGVFELKASY